MSSPENLSTSLSSLVLDPDWGLERARPRSERNRPPDYDERFDFHTLAYDVFFDESESLICLYCPKLYNLEKVLRGSRIQADAHAVEIRSIRKFKKLDVVFLEAPAEAHTLSITGQGWSAAVPIQRQELEAFQGRNCLVTLSRDNDLGWIRDWAEYHVKEHGAQGVLLFDNGSSAYGVEDLEGTLASVEALEVFSVLPAPFPHGAPGRRPFWEPASKFLQTSLLNLAHRRFLGSARAVLSVDVDELVWSKEGRSVFDETAASPLGYLRVSGTWVFPAPDKEGHCRHRDHLYSDSQGREGREKWCVVPGGPLKGHYWDVHRIRGVWRKHLTASTRCRYWHFSHVSTDWKRNRRKVPRGAAVPDPFLAATMARVFSPPPRE